MRALPNFAARAQMRIRANHRSLSDARPVYCASRPDQNAVADVGIADHTIGTNPAVGSDASGTENLNERFDGSVRSNHNVAVDNAGLRIKNRDASSHELLAFCSTNALINVNQLSARIAAQHFIL